MRRILPLAIVAAALLAPAAHACTQPNPTPIIMLSGGHTPFKIAANAMQACGNFTAALDKEYRKKQPAVLAATPSQAHIAGVTPSALAPLLHAGSVRPLDAYVEKHGGGLSPAQLIRVNGRIMAIAVTINTQHLMYRKDILDNLGIAVPQTYTELLAAAEKIKAAGVVDYPLGGTYKTGWNLAQEFINLYLARNNTIVDGNNNPAINNPDGVATLETMKALTEYMTPQYLDSDPAFVQKQMQQGEIAITNLWASRARAIDNEEKSQVAGLVEYAAAPSLTPGGVPATTLWWDGMAIAKNIDDAKAELAFQLLMQGISAKTLTAHKDAAIWLTDAFPPSRAASGAIASSKGGAPAYPATKAMTIMHSALGKHIAAYLTGEKPAAEILTDIESHYRAIAKKQELL